jgi:putative mRNA 3-end processing factor
MLFDPADSDPTIPNLFITHAHYDHSKGFQFPTQKKYSTKETKEIYEVHTGHSTGNWEPIRVGRRLKFGEVEVEAHDAGHILGSVQYEIITAEGNVVYASHINFTDTLVSRAAEVAPCDTLVIEATFPAPTLTLPPREQVIAEMVKWTLECIREKRIPAFAVEPLGNAQELTKIFNVCTELPVIVHPQIARINKTYENNGVGLRYIDASTTDAQALIGHDECVVLVPRRFDASRYGDFRIAYVTGWPSLAQRSVGQVFALSDQADLDQILHFVQETHPRVVLTFRGGSKLLAELVAKKYGMVGQELASELPRAKPAPKLDQERVARCEDTLRKIVQVQEFTYEKRDLLALGLKDGFKAQEIEQALLHLTQRGEFRYSAATDGYSLSRPK